MKPFTLCVMSLSVLAGPGALQAETHKFIPREFYTTVSAANPPALRLKSGDRVATVTSADGGTTGPFFVEGAAPGDMIVVTIEKLDPNESTGMSMIALTPASLEDPSEIGSNKDAGHLTWTIDKAKRTVRLELAAIAKNVNWSERFVAPVIELPLRPMLGFIGLAPAGEEAVKTAAAGAFGGGMAYPDVAPGAKVMLPVSQPGGLLFLGQGYARQGDGDLTKAGIATSMDVEFSVELVKKKEWPHSSVVRAPTVAGEFDQFWPRIETGDAIMTVGTGATLLQAVQRATLEMHHWLDDDFGMSEKMVSVFIGQAFEYQITHLGEGSFSVAAKVEKAWLPKAVPAR